MTTDNKLDKIIDLLIAQNNLLTSIMLSLRQPAPMATVNTPISTSNNIRAEIEQKIEAARREAQSRINQIQTAIPELNSTLKSD